MYLEGPGSETDVRRILEELEGVEGVLTRVEAVDRFHLAPETLGDLVVLGDRDTMFGDMDTAFEELPSTCRAHGSLHEMDLPLIIEGQEGALPEDGAYFRTNRDLTRALPW